MLLDVLINCCCCALAAPFNDRGSRGRRRLTCDSLGEPKAGTTGLAGASPAGPVPPAAAAVTQVEEVVPAPTDEVQQQEPGSKGSTTPGAAPVPSTGQSLLTRHLQDSN